MTDGFSDYTKIRTSKGNRTFKELATEKNIKVMGTDGAWHKATIARSLEKEMLWNIVFVDEKGNLKGIVCSANHKWLTVDEMAITTQKLQDISATIDCAKDDSIKKKTWEIYTVKPNYTKDYVWTLEEPQTHGFLLSDNLLTADCSL